MGFGSYTFGTGNFGNTAPAVALGLLCVDSCDQSHTNGIQVVFGPAQPQMLDPFSPDDALNAANYTLTATAPAGATERMVQWVERIDDYTVQLWLDGPVDAGATYALVVSGVLDVDCVPISTLCDGCAFDAFNPEPTPNAITTEDDKSLDVANPQLMQDAQQRDGQDAPLGSFQINQRGDYALEANPHYLRKRIIRRATTRLGQFFHLPGYGFGQPLKGRLSPSVLRSIQGEALRQIQQEPDVATASVRVRQASAQNPNILVLDIKVQDTSGRSDNFAVPVDFSPGSGG